MNFAYCLCPSLTNAHSNVDSLDELAMNVISKKASIIIDNYNILMDEYSNQLTIQNIQSFEFFEKLLSRHQDKIIKSDYIPMDVKIDDESLASPKIVFDITAKTKTTRAKYIICQNDALYSDLEEDAFRHRVSVITSNDEICSEFPDYRVHIVSGRLKKQISFSLRTIADRQYFKTASEDECNDQIRDLLTNAGYLIKDQTRRGVSQNGYSPGEIDLLVYCGNEPYAIIEAMILDSVNKSYIHSHIDKALTKYDSHGLKDFYILVYYRGADFNSFAKRYYEHISTLTQLNGNPASPVSLEGYELAEATFNGYREIQCFGERRGYNINCTHMLIDQS
ncbi:hypothetical protein [Aeromonas enteropelogenes]|uniref:Uncharacterized protein n=1 Tax=Aeromonas enteropelogenes TaxID=29489 RepID=A0ABU9J765_AEREN